MAATTEKMLVYDGGCPLCVWYTTLFVQARIMAPEERRTFAMFTDDELHCMMEFPRARHEIPLVDCNGGPTLYGVDALGYLLGRRFPLLPRLLVLPPVAALARLAYAIVSYNRRFLALAGPCSSTVCAPDYHPFYRSLFVVLLFALSLVVSLPFWAVLGEHAVPVAAATGAGLALYAAVLHLRAGAHFREYLGHCAVVVLAGSGVLGAVTFILSMAFTPAIAIAYATAFAAVFTTRLHDIRLHRLFLTRSWLYTWRILAAGWSIAVGAAVVR